MRPIQAVFKIWLQSGNMVYASMQQMALSPLWVMGPFDIFRIVKRERKSNRPKGLPLGPCVLSGW